MFFTEKTMTQYDVFKKAKGLYYSGFVRQKAESDRKVYFDVDDFESGKTHDVVMHKTIKGLTFDCDCTSRSLSKGSPHLCSHILGVVFYIYHKTNIK
jgi:hypothetical protein